MLSCISRVKYKDYFLYMQILFDFFMKYYFSILNKTNNNKYNKVKNKGNTKRKTTIHFFLKLIYSDGQIYLFYYDIPNSQYQYIEKNQYRMQG